MLRRTTGIRKYYGNHYYSPMPVLPVDYTHRGANPKPIYLTKKRDPKNAWGLHNTERASLHPSMTGIDRHNFNIWESRGGLVGEIPPVPVYREKIWCHGHHIERLGHPRIFIKCPHMKVVQCKWCRTKYINMSTPEDTDENWRKEIHEIAVTSEPLSEVTMIKRDKGGTLHLSMFQDGRTPDEFVYRSAYNPEKYRWKKVGRKMVPPSQWRKLEAEAEAKKLAEGDKKIEE